MSNVFRQYLHQFRPPGYVGRGDRYLPEVAVELRRVLTKAQRSVHSSFGFSEVQLSELVVLLVEFAEDVHNEIGFWKAIEDRNRELFGTPLPFHCEPSEADSLCLFDLRRVQHFIWTVCRQPQIALLVSPRDFGVHLIAVAASEFLQERFARIPKDSGWKKFGSAPVNSAGDVKIRLLAIARVYLFRSEILGVAHAGPEDSSIDRLEISLMTLPTTYTGLYPVEILSRVLPISAEDRATLASWRNTRNGLYRILSEPEAGPGGFFVHVRDEFTRREYRVTFDPVPKNMNEVYRAGSLISARLVPWRGDWYFGSRCLLFNTTSSLSGHQYLDRHRVQAQLSEPESAAIIASKLRELHAAFVARHGSDLIACENGLAAAIEIRRSMTGESEEQARSQLSQADGEADRRFPDALLKETQRVGVFFDPEFGPELLLNYDEVTGVIGQNRPLEKHELRIIERIVLDPTISPALVRRLIQSSGRNDILKSFLLPEEAPEYSLEFLFRSFKGTFYYRPEPNSFIELAFQGEPGAIQRAS